MHVRLEVTSGSGLVGRHPVAAPAATPGGTPNHRLSANERFAVRLFPDWVPADVKKANRQLTEEEAISQLPVIETVLSAKRN